MNKFGEVFMMHESASMNRPAWTSESNTGMFEAHKHKHSVERGKFKLQKNYWKNRKV